NGGILRATGDEADFISGFNPGEVIIDAGGAFIDTNGYDIGISADLDGEGGLTKQSAGTLTLSGTNTYGGTTTVEAGTLRAGDAGAFVQNGAYAIDGGTLDLGGFDLTMSQLSGSSGEVAIGSASLTLDQASDTTFAGTLSGTGDFFKNGSGTLLLTGNSTGFAGTATISGGHLIVNGSLGGNVDITGGTLSGSGSVGALTIGAGVTVAPGNSIGTLTVAGDLIFDPGATYAVEADPGGTASDLIHVGGTAFLNGASVVHVGYDGSYEPLTTYTILTADGGISGTFGATTTNYAFLAALLTYDANNVYLNIARNQIAFRDAALTRNQAAAAEAAESLGAGHAVYDAIVTLPDDAAVIRAGFDALSGEIHASAKTALMAETGIVRDAANERLRSAFGDVGAAATPIHAFWPGAPELIAPDDGVGLVSWSTAFGDWSEADSDGNAATLSHNYGGLLAGADAMLGDWRLGLMGGYGRSHFDVDDRSSSGSSDNYHLGLYGGRQWGALALRTGIAHTWHEIETRRRVTVGDFSDSLEADHGAGTLQAFGEIGYRFDMAASAFEPFLNLAHLRHRTDGFTEQGGAAALTVASQTTSTDFTTLGLRAETPIRLGEANVTLRGMAGWRHAFGDVVPLSTHAFAGGDPFTIAGVPLARNAFVLDAGLDLDLTENASFGLAYAGQIGDDARQHSARATLSLRF
ncbi:MAG TPA: autotransporter domain-containing protein, partial [Sinorhizobium sp.]|nr:autotransporter domain-containing protein [Sinorhizobium sp.]